MLIALSINGDESSNVMEKIINVRNSEKKGYEFFIKSHPLLNISDISDQYNNENWPESFIEVEGLLFAYMDKIDLLISSGVSSVGLEAISLGNPVIILETLLGISHQPIPESIPKELWPICRTSDDITEALNLFNNRTKEELHRQIEISSPIKNNYFEPITKKGIYKFLELNN